MPSTTKNIETLESDRLDPIANEVLRGDGSQAKPKSSVAAKKPAVSAQAPQIAPQRLPVGEKGSVAEKAAGDASRANLNAIRKAAAKATTASTNAISEPVPATPHVDCVEDEKGQVDVSDRKLKKLVEPVAPATMTPPIAPAVPVPTAVAQPPVAQPVATVAKVEDKSKLAKASGAPRQGFKTLEYIVYPAHGVGQITAIEEQEVAGYKLELFVISFVKDKMILKVPVPKVTSVGMRKLAEAPVVKRALDTLTGRARVKRTMWSRRAQEYEAKINSGDLVSIAEVVRDLYRSDAQPEQSYSERQLYEAALDRIAREIAAVQKLTDQEALKVIGEQLLKSPRRVKVEETDAEDTEENETDVVEAA